MALLLNNLGLLVVLTFAVLTCCSALEVVSSPKVITRSNNSVEIKCQKSANETLPVIFYLDDVVYNTSQSKFPNKDFTIQKTNNNTIKVSNLKKNFNKVNCTVGSKKSNSISIPYIDVVSYKHSTSKFELKKNFTAECKIDVKPNTTLNYQVAFLLNNKETCHYNVANNSPTFNVMKTPILNLTEKVKKYPLFSINVIPLNKTAQGVYSCRLTYLNVSQDSSKIDSKNGSIMLTSSLFLIMLVSLFTQQL